VLRPVFICDGCVDIFDVREAAPPDDGLDIPESPRWEVARWPGRAMSDVLLLIFVSGVILLAVSINLGVLVAWVRSRRR
jgi:hypothetical protein